MNQQRIVYRKKDELGENLQKQFFTFLYNYKTNLKKEEYSSLVPEQKEKDEQKMEIDEEQVYIYRVLAKDMIYNNRAILVVDCRHLFDWDKTYDLRKIILPSFHRIEPYLNHAVWELVDKISSESPKNKRFNVSFCNVPDYKTIRQLKTQEIGKLINISGTITRSSEVKPELISGTFKCEMCEYLISGVEQQFRYTEPKTCLNMNCNNHNKWKLVEEDSTFVNWQKLRVQENPNDIPTGSMPRSIEVILRNELVETCKPGDKCTFTGNLIVVPDITSLSKPGEKIQQQIKRDAFRREEQKVAEGITGLKNLGIKDMNYKLLFIANNIILQSKKSINIIQNNDDDNDELKKNFSNIEIDKVIKMKEDIGIYSNLAKAIAPNVYGNDEVKKGILLMLLGGVNKETEEGIKLRGDINICLVGDPSTAKSQFLKYVCQLIPRSVYTSGKGSSAAGLTAGVVRDAETGEFCIEVGALMLADNGICCIDEFDKMDIKDQVAIHEAMEQQTISIAKAGIQATLMTRTSILAAANPVFGRYDKTKPLKMNIDISAPIMSRFDLFFIIVDECSEYTDYSIAQHIINLQQKGIIEDSSISSPYSQDEVALYIRYAKNFKPQFTQEAAIELRDQYKKLRQSDISSQKTSYRITVRQLESLIRLSEALAKVHLVEKITPLFVQEAARLLQTSIIHVDMPDVNLDFETEWQKNKEKAENEGNDQRIRSISGVEYDKIKTGVILIIKELEVQGIKTSPQKIIEAFLEKNFEVIETQKQAVELTEKLNSVIDRLINKENILISSEDPDDKNNMILSINVNYDAPLFE